MCMCVCAHTLAHVCPVQMQSQFPVGGAKRTGLTSLVGIEPLADGTSR